MINFERTAQEQRVIERGALHLYLVAGISFLVLCVIWFFWPPIVGFLAATYINSNKSAAGIDFAVLGPFGDMFGAFSSLFTGLAFFAAGLGMYFQGQALSGQRAQFAQQQAQIKAQNFQGAFFNLIDMYKSCVSGLVIRNLPHRLPVEGRKALEPLSSCLIEECSQHGFFSGESCGIQDFIAVYRNFCRGKEHYMSVHFGSLYHLCKLIDRNSPCDQKWDYVSLARTQLSAHELVLLSANILVPENEGTRQYAIDFKLLKYLRSSCVAPDFVQLIYRLYAESSLAQSLDEELRIPLRV